MGDDDESVKLQSGDNEVFSVSKEVACQAVTIKEMLEGECPPAHARLRSLPPLCYIRRPVLWMGLAGRVVRPRVC
eukprot:COSAG05_NODE_8_length_40675_cov_148.837539_26_plen_75_part_00